MSFDTQTKLAIYRHFAETGQRPSLQVVAERVGADVRSVREAYVRLRAERVLVLEPDGVSIQMAPPFSGVPTQHVVIVDDTKYFANCAWDSFCIPAALQRAGRLLVGWQAADCFLDFSDRAHLDLSPNCSIKRLFRRDAAATDAKRGPGFRTHPAICLNAVTIFHGLA
jgi:hypothetical protein